MKFLCEHCKAKYQIGDDKVAGKAVRMKCRRCGHDIHVSASALEGAVSTDGSSVVVERSSVAPAPVAAPAPPAEAGAPRFRPRNDSADDDESTSIMAIPMRAPAGPSRTPTSLGLGAVGFAPAGRLGAPGGASSGALGQGGARPSGGAVAPRPVGAPRAGAPGPTNAPGAPAARVARPSRPGIATRPPGAAPIAPAPARFAGVQGREPLGTGAAPSGASSPPLEDWYVGIGGVPLGPVPIAVIRDKALAGLVDGESLVWRDGFEEWRPLKNYPELLEVITSPAALSSLSAASGKPGPSVDPSGRSRRSESSAERFAPQDLMPASPVRPASSPSLVAASSPVSPHRAVGRSPSAPSFSTEALSPSASPLPAASPQPSASRAAERPTPGTASSFTAVSPGQSSSAERPQSRPQIPIDVLADPFSPTGSKPALRDASQPTSSARTSNASLPNAEPIVGLSTITKGESQLDLDKPVRVKRSQGLPALAYAFIAMAAAFGGVAAWFLFSTKQSLPIIDVSPPQQPPPVVSASIAPSSAPPDPTVDVEVGPATTADSTGVVVKPGPLASSGPRPKAAPSGTAAPFDTSGFISTVPGPNANGPSTAQGSSGPLSAGEIQGVIAQNQPLIKRKCWQPALDSRTAGSPSTARINVSVVIGASGNVESASAGGGEGFPGLASCIASRVKGWKFPPSASSTPANIPFVFAGQ